MSMWVFVRTYFYGTSVWQKRDMVVMRERRRNGASIFKHNKKTKRRAWRSEE